MIHYLSEKVISFTDIVFPHAQNVDQYCMPVILYNNAKVPTDQFVIITTQRYDKCCICCRRLSFYLCLCVVCVCRSHSGIVTKWLNVGYAHNATR